jgi:hypothetical protein
LYNKREHKSFHCFGQHVHGQVAYEREISLHHIIAIQGDTTMDSSQPTWACNT